MSTKLDPIVLAGKAGIPADIAQKILSTVGEAPLLMLTTASEALNLSPKTVEDIAGSMDLNWKHALANVLTVHAQDIVALTESLVGLIPGLPAFGSALIDTVLSSYGPMVILALANDLAK